MIDADENDLHRPLGLNLLAGLYLFFFLVSSSTFGNPFPFLGHIYEGAPAPVSAFVATVPKGAMIAFLSPFFSAMAYVPLVLKYLEEHA